MSYNQHQQGFNQNLGGVPHGNTPAFPNVEVGEVMQPYLAIISAKVYNDMALRNTQYTNYMASLYSQNGYHNELFEEILIIVSNLAEYTMATRNQDFNTVIDNVIVDCNSVLLENHYRRHPNKIPVALTESEKTRYRAAKSKIDSLRVKLSDFFKHKDQNMNNYNPNNGFQQQPNQQMNPQQYQQFQEQQAYAQQQQFQQQMAYQQQMNNQQQYNNQPVQRVPYNGGQPVPPNNWNQPPGNDFALRVQQRMQQGNQQQQFQQPTYNPNANAFNANNLSPQQMQQMQQMQYQQMQYHQQQQQQQFQQQQMHNQHAGFATSSNQMQQHHQQPVRSASLSNSGYNPMPTIDESQLNASKDRSANNNSGGDPFARNAQFMKEHNKTINQGYVDDTLKVGNHNSFTQGASFNQTVEPIPSNTTLQNYIAKVRAHANSLGLPGDEASLSFLEEAITNQDPKNGFIDPKNAYSEAKHFQNVMAPDGHYNLQNGDLTQEDISIYSSNEDLSSDSFATRVRNDLASKSDKQMIRQANGGYELISNDLISAFKQEFPGVDINTADIRAYKQNAPYPFAFKSLDDEWLVPDEKYHLIKNKGWFNVKAVYPVYSNNGFYVVDNAGTITDFFSRPKTIEGLNMDYDLHDDTKFFTPMSPKDLAASPDEQSMLDAFANLQTQQKVSEVLADIEQQAGVVDGESTALLIETTVVIEDQVNGEIAGDDYYTLGYSALRRAMGEVDYEMEDVSVRYRHVHMYPWHIKDDDLKAVRKLRFKDNYSDIAEVLIELSERESFPDSWFNRLNDIATNYVNDVVSTQYHLNDADYFYIDSFCLDANDAIKLMEKLGHGDSFNDTAKQLVSTLLYVWDNTKPVFSDYYNDVIAENMDDVDDGQVNIVGFGIVRDVTVIPLHSRDVPLHANKDRCLLTKQGFESLWQVAKDRIDNRDARTGEIVIVTSDNRHMYITETAVHDVYAITKKSIFSL